MFGVDVSGDNGGGGDVSGGDNSGGCDHMRGGNVQSEHPPSAHLSH
jgi:hypothetical protein